MGRHAAVTKSRQDCLPDRSLALANCALRAQLPPCGSLPNCRLACRRLLFGLTELRRSPYLAAKVLKEECCQTWVMMTVHLVVLNYNGRKLLAECLPSLLRAAECSRRRCEVVVIDNGSIDNSVDYLRVVFPSIRVFEQSNRGLCSYNDVLARLTGRVAILLNNDIKLAEDSIDPLVEPLLSDETPGGSVCFMTAPLCRLFDGVTHEGLQAAVRWRWGLVEATAYFPGHEQASLRPGLTAAAGPVMAVERRRFLELGGFDPLYLPGRLEDLDFAFRGYMAGYYARYVPEAVAYHKGQVSFNAAFGRCGSDALALRNTLLFQWKNLRRPLHVLRHLAALPARFALDCARAPVMPKASRWAFSRAFAGALARAGRCWRSPCPPRRSPQAERAYFRDFSAACLAASSRPIATSSTGSRRSLRKTGVEGHELLASAGGPHS